VVVPTASPPEWASLFDQPVTDQMSNGSAAVRNTPLDTLFEGFMKAAPAKPPASQRISDVGPAAKQERPVDTLFGGFAEPAAPVAPQAASGQGSNGIASVQQAPIEDLVRPAQQTAAGGAPALQRWPALRRDDGGLEVHHLHVRPIPCNTLSTLTLYLAQRLWAQRSSHACDTAGLVNAHELVVLQVALRGHGYHCPDDDTVWWQFGDATDSALRTFQVCRRCSWILHSAALHCSSPALCLQ